MNLTIFRDLKFPAAIKQFFKELNVPVNYVTDDIIPVKEILNNTYKDNDTFGLIDEVYITGMVDDAAFEGNKSLAIDNIKSDYDGILIFGVTLQKRENDLLPTRTQLAEIARAFNREFFYTPVVVIFKYEDGKREYIALANTERLQYKQTWREGEKAGKVSLLREIDINHPHRGHIDIVEQLRIQTKGVKAVDSFTKLYTYWQEVFNVSLLNKRFYKELSNWYFWAIKQVSFPSKPTEVDAITKNAKLEDLIQEHNATNVIRLLTRLLFTWFIKEKKLIPEELFDLDSLQKDILNEISPYHENGLFNQANKDSVYYKAILQNLFFASLNCPIKPEGEDSRERGFRGEGYGTHFGIDYLMRYKRYFKNPDAFLNLVNSCVPFLNGGLFECLDDKFNKIYIDGFSDNMTKGELLIVPDYLFFGVEEHVDLSTEYGVSNSGTKNAAVKGLINILKSYKFTITENTPIEEDVALDPELLGKVFENLLASYNPETKTTARKQTGSFYTPREIVNYMVDESLIAYLKNAVTDWGLDDKLLDENLHQLASFDSINPFLSNEELTRKIIFALDSCKILDPACGSGAFPMGVLQKMVHVLQKLDPENQIWKEVQVQKVQEETNEIFKTIDDKTEREEKLKEINNAFDQRVNDPDYARKLYLIENCIYGVDIQPIATQISKLRFFISLVVDQKNNCNANENFGVRPLPNLETKFVTANSLIGIEKPEAQLSLYDTKEVKILEAELKKVRHKLFGARAKDTKLKYRQRDEELRHTISVELENNGWRSDSAQKLACWNPYDQNVSSTFFDPEWMFDVADGFDVVIGNPPYRPIQKYDFEVKKAWSKQGYKTYSNSGNIYFLFYEKALNITRSNGSVMFITSNQWMRNDSGEPLRKFFISKFCPELLIDFRGTDIFDNVAVLSNILMISNNKCIKPMIACDVSKIKKNYQEGLHQIVQENLIILNSLSNKPWLIFDKRKHILREQVIKEGVNIEKWNLEIYRGILTGYNDAFYLNEEDRNRLINIDPKNNEIIRPMLRGKDLVRYSIAFEKVWLIFTRRGINIDLYPSIKEYLFNFYQDLKPKKISKEKHGRKPGKYEWYEIQDSINYYKKFDEPKMIFMNMSKELVFSYDSKGEFLTNQKCFIVTGNNIKYLTAFFNSKLFSYFFKDNFPELLGDVRDVSKVYFEKIPVKLPDNINTIKIIEFLVETIVHVKMNGLKLFTYLEQMIEGLIFEVYFHDHMREKEIDVLYFVERDVETALQGRCFEELNEQDKDQIILQLHHNWSHPDNEVRNRIKMFAVRSPEILKPILES